MLSNIKATLDQYFIDNWTATPFFLEDEDIITSDEYIAVNYMPADRVRVASETTIMTTGYIYVYITALYPIRCYGLFDSLAIMMDEKEIGTTPKIYMDSCFMVNPPAKIFRETASERLNRGNSYHYESKIAIPFRVWTN